MGIFSSLQLVDSLQQEPTPSYQERKRSLTAAAERINLSRPNSLVSTEEQAYVGWQKEAWDYYDAIGEVKYAFQLVGAVMSRLRIFPALNLDEDAPPVSITSWIHDTAMQNENERIEFARKELNPPKSFTKKFMDEARSVVALLSNGYGGTPGLLRDFGINMAVAGECYLVEHKTKWQIYSTQEIQIRRSDKKAFLRKFRSVGSGSTGVGSGPYDEELPSKTFIGRIWRPHPRFSYEPDSSMLALREACYELTTLQTMIRGIARSRMNAGILFLPDGLSVAAQMLDDDEDDDVLEQELFEAMTAPITDESAASSIVPMVLRGPSDLADKIRHIEMSRSADQWLVTRADRVLEQIMQGIDVPKDLVTGLANVKYSNAVVIDESLYKSHIEPLALMFCDAVTIMYLRPAMKSAFPNISDEDLEKLCLWYDPAEVVSRPDPASSADSGYDRNAISAAAWRRAHGFSNTDAPTQAELATRLAMEKATVPPDMAGALIKHMVPDVFEAAKEQAREDLPVPFPDSARKLLEGQTMPAQEDLE